MRKSLFGEQRALVLFILIVLTAFAMSVLMPTKGYGQESTSAGTSASQAAPERMREVVVGWHLERSWGGSKKTGSIKLWTSAFTLVEFPQDVPENAGAVVVKDARLINDLIAELAKQGQLKGVDLNARGTELFITGFSFPVRGNMVISSKDVPETPR